ncbi:hypothetical protein [Clostridium perfringens]|uniref:hypothetical protein n=1 Tax=Clostridium perfringens TaxID=1502 RepID=UPI00112E9E2A|nr:hypothetical protein XA71_11715 [Clostridium perfringens A]
MGEKVLEIRELKNCEIDDIMKIWLESTIEAHYFIKEEYWKKNYEVVRIIKEQENEDSGDLEYLMSYSKNSSKNQ